MEHATARVTEARNQNKAEFNRTHRLWPKKIKEGDWVLVYDNSLDNEHRSTLKFAKRRFETYVVASANDNATYHLLELDGTRMTTSVSRKRIKAFKSRKEAEPDPAVGSKSGDSDW